MVPEVEEATTADTTEEVVVVAEEEADTDVDNSEVNVAVNPVVVVEDGGDDSATDAEIDRAVDTAERLTNLENQVGAMVTTLGDVASRVDYLTMREEQMTERQIQTAETVEAVGGAVAEGIEEDLDLDADNDPDTPPETAKRHAWFRTYKEWRGIE